MLVTGSLSNAQTQPPSGEVIALEPRTGNNVVALTATIPPCDKEGSDGVVGYVTGPGAFAPSDTRPKGVVVVNQTTGFSREQPIVLPFRGSFQDFAQELGVADVPPGDYVFSLECVETALLDVIQTYSVALTFTSSTAYGVTSPPAQLNGVDPGVTPGLAGGSPAAELPRGSAPEQGIGIAPTTGSSSSGQPNLVLVVLISLLVVVLVAWAVVYGIRRRGSR